MVNVLLFDDSIYILRFLETVLKKHAGNIWIFTSQTFDEAVTIVNSEEIHIAFIDLQVPGKNGADFINYLNSKKHLRKIKKVIITDTGKNSLLKTSLEKEVDAYLHKEDIFDDFQKIIDQLDLVNF